MVRKVVIPVAGSGIRLLPMTKEFPKEMLPIPVKDKHGTVCFKPMLQLVFEQLYSYGFRQYVFVMGRQKRAIEDHFLSNGIFRERAGGTTKRNSIQLKQLQEFCRKVSRSTIFFVNQPKPIGFGDAVAKAKLITGNDPFLIHVGDDIVISRDNDHLDRMMKVFRSRNADGVFLAQEVKNPREYGVIFGQEIEPGIIEVRNVIEKPKKMVSTLAIVGIYAFKPIIYRTIETARSNAHGEIELTDAISVALNWHCRIYAVKLKNGEKRIEIGNPQSYLNSLGTCTGL